MSNQPANPGGQDGPEPDLDAIVAAGRAAIATAGDLEALREVEQQHLARRSPLGDVQRALGALPAEGRRTLGQRVNQARAALQQALAARRAELETARDAALLEAERIDVTLPGRVRPRGTIHPINRTIDEAVDIFLGLGYRVAEGPEVETDWYNFEALNMPPDHPARSLWDTLYIAGAPTLLRTHTSPVQIRAMQAQEPPIYIIAPGRCGRRDAFDATHSPMFHQVEGLAVDRRITFADLKGTLDAFAHALFGEQLATRFRPSYFPFTEPSAEFDVACPNCEGAGCNVCGRSGWIELLGCGMVHPNVLKAAGYDPEAVSGFAFGMGVERIAMRGFGITDMRQLFDNDVRFLARFAG
ncbi:MAG TPA: phenylalanine--tRNA ligase subunit alpha [Vicinamibacteria bacterium]|nr:phenylalanine--tRNA ligase subunit alpha [Vicinamibacteria bacterium]